MDRNGDGFIDDADSRAGGNERGQARSESATRPHR
jgi:hypothetical protein